MTLDIQQVELLDKYIDLSGNINSVFAALKNRAYDRNRRHNPLYDLIGEPAKKSGFMDDLVSKSQDRFSPLLERLWRT